MSQTSASDFGGNRTYDFCGCRLRQPTLRSPWVSYFKDGLAAYVYSCSPESASYPEVRALAASLMPAAPGGVGVTLVEAAAAAAAAAAGDGRDDRVYPGIGTPLGDSTDAKREGAPLLLLPPTPPPALPLPPLPRLLLPALLLLLLLPPPLLSGRSSTPPTPPAV